MSDKEDIQDDWKKFQKELETLENSVEDLHNLDTDDTDDAVLANVLKAHNEILNEFLKITDLKQTCTSISFISARLKPLPFSTAELADITRYAESIREILNDKLKQLGNEYSKTTFNK